MTAGESAYPPDARALGAVDVVVIGAGFAGLSAARALHEGGLSVVVLEARDRVGGRAHTELHHGTWIDLGGQWIGPGQDRIGALVKELGFATYPQHEDGDDVVLAHDGPQRTTNFARSLSDEDLAGYVTLVRDLDAIAQQVPLDAPWQGPGAVEADAITLREWVRSRDVPVTVVALFEVTVNAVFAASSAQLSLLHAAYYLRSAGGWSKLTDTEGGAQQDRIEGGMQPVAQALAALLPQGTVCLGHAVNSIEQSDDGVTVVATTSAAEKTFTCAQVVVAVPPTLAGRIRYEPPLPAQRDQLMQHMPQGSVIKFHVLYDDPWWRADGLSGFVLAPNEPISVTFDCTPPAGAPGLITGFFEGPSAVAAGLTTTEARQKVVVDVLVRALGDRARNVLAYLDLDWSAEQFTRGCYGAHLPPGAWTVYGPALRPPVGLVHWAGTETAEHWTGYVDGAIDSGLRVAAEVLSVHRVRT